MLKIILVDDESFTRQQFTDIFSWIDKDVCLAATFSNVKSTIDYINKVHVDVIITDIVLKNENGIDIAKYVHENKINTKVVFLSAHKSFDYAHQGYKYGVYSYITKPFDIEELKSLIDRIKADVEKERNILSRYISDIFANDLTNAKQDYTTNTFYGCFLTIDFAFNDASDMEKYISSSSYQYFQNVLSMFKSKLNYSLLNCNNSKAIVLVFTTSNIGNEKFIQILSEESRSLISYLSETLRFNATIRKTSYFDNMMDMLQKYMISDNEKYVDLTDFLINSFAERINTANVSKVTFALDSIIDIVDSKQIISEFVYKLTEKINVTPPGGLAAMNKSELKEYLKKTLAKYSDDAKKQKHNELIDKALEYINTHYDQNISQADVATYLHMNTAYFSRYFKSKLNINFSEYLISLRMQKAAELLSDSNAPIDVIIRSVGYNHVPLFYKTFKNQFGQTPNEYRSRLQDDAGK